MTTQNDNKPASPTVCPAPRRGRFDQPEGAGLISLPVKPSDKDKVDESFRASGLGSIDQVFGTDWNQQEKPMSI
jgi:hypothetical protein